MRILFCCHLPLDRKLGVSKHYLELADAFRTLGWEAHVADCKEITGNVSLPGTPDVFGPFLRDYLRAQAGRYDVVEYQNGLLPYPRTGFPARPLLVARCLLLQHHFRTTPIPPQPTWRAQIGHWWFRGQRRREAETLIRLADQTVREADLTVVSNDRDKTALVANGADPDRVVVFPLGLTAERRRLFDAVPEQTPAKPVVGYVGTFDPRKGMCEFPALVDRLVRRIPDIAFKLLGTAGLIRDEEGVLRYFPRKYRSRIIVHSKFEPAELPTLLSDCCVGVFPSWVESFGFGVLEMLAAGMPVVAYDVPGPPMMLPPDYLTPRGDAVAMADRVAQLLADSGRLQQARRWAKLRAAEFDWTEIAGRTAEEYLRRSSARAAAHSSAGVTVPLFSEQMLHRSE